MSKIDDSGTAFPWQGYVEGDSQPTNTPGMSLRDYYAGLALQGMLAHSTRYRPRKQGQPDAMIAERKRYA